MPDPKVWGVLAEHDGTVIRSGLVASCKLENAEPVSFADCDLDFLTELFSRTNATVQFIDDPESYDYSSRGRVLTVYPEVAPPQDVSIPIPVLKHMAKGPGTKPVSSYLRDVAYNIEHGYSIGGSNVQAMVCKLLRDTAQAMRAQGAR